MEQGDVLTAETPNVGRLQMLLSRCSPVQGEFDRIRNNEEILLAKWSGQTPDGRKAGADALPWENASDIQVRLADGICQEQADMLTLAFWRAQARERGQEPSDTMLAGEATRILQHYVFGRMRDELEEEVELASQYFLTYGLCVLHPVWLRQVELQGHELTMEMVTAQAQRAAAAGEPTLAGLPEMIRDAQFDGESVAILREFYEKYTEANLAWAEPMEIPELTDAQIRRVIRELREEGRSTVPLPVLVENRPSIRTLKPWSEVIFPEDTVSLKRSVVFVRETLLEEELRERALVEGWDEAWVEAAVKLKGQYSSLAMKAQSAYTGTVPMAEMEGSQMIEVLTAYTRRLDAQGVPGIYMTVFHAGITRSPEGKDDLVAAHGLMDFEHGVMPFVVGRRERLDRRLSASRGVPEVAKPWQRELKVQRDSLIDRTSYATLPAVLLSGLDDDIQYKFGPAARVPYLPGREPKFMDIPRGDGTAVEVQRDIRQECNEYFGRASAEVAPAKTLLRGQALANRYLGMWRQAFGLMWRLICQYARPEELQRITGSPVALPQGPNEIRNQYDLQLTFNVQEMDPEMTMAKLSAVSAVLPEDATGMIDRGRLIELKLAAIDPEYPRLMLSDTAGASQKLFENVRTELAQMFLGNPPSLAEKDPTAKMKLQFAQQIVGANPTYQQALQGNERFRGMMDKWVQNLVFSVKQEENKVVGRLGVKPE